jgi:diguanylate cyclase (GGDEF)-like protein/PAS domain S-box-containing protein
MTLSSGTMDAPLLQPMRGDAPLHPETLHRIVDGAPFGVAFSDAAGRILYLNPGFTAMLGYTRDDLPDLDAWWQCAYPDPEFRTWVRREWNKFVAPGPGWTTLDRVFTVHARDGSTREIRFTVGAFPDGSATTLFDDVTTTHRLQAEIRASEERFRQIFEHVASIAVQGYAADGTVRYWNAASERLYGYAKDEAIGANLVDLIIPQSIRDEVRAAVAGMVATGEGAPSEELVLQTKYGTPVPVLSTHVVVRPSEGEAQLYCLDVDLSAQKGVEEDLRRSEGMFRDLVDSTAGIVWEADARTFTFTFVSREAERLLGYPVSDWHQPGFWVSHLHPEDAGWAPAYCASCTGRLEPHDFEYRILAKDGRTVWLRDIVKVVAENGEPRWLRGVMVDITLTKMAQQRHTLVVETSMDAYIVTDQQGRIIECNQSACELSGYSRQEFMQLHIADLEARETAAQMEEHRQRLIETGRDRFESAWRRRDGGVIEIEVTVHYEPVAAVSYAFVRDITQRKQHERELDRVAHYDALTGVPNRNLLADRMRQSMSQARRSEAMMAICYLDLDGFKPINDRYGHDAGDAVLVEIAQRLKGQLRSGDTVARIGGDEFVLLLLGLHADEDCVVALERILAAVAAPIGVAGNEVQVSASLGATIYPRDDADADTLLRHADQAMYLAKQAGRNRYHLHNPEADRAAQARSDRLAEIHRAFADGEFVLYVQPQVDMRQGRVLGAEALLRWNDPRRGVVPPGEFLPEIETTDLIVEVGDWVLRQALDLLAQWGAAGAQWRIGVNIAARHLLRDDFVARLRALLAAHPQVQPSWLDLEVLETVALEDIPRVAGIIRECQALGVGFSLDDFGTGYSSLAYLKALPANMLKIDQLFVRDMLGDQEDKAIVQGVIGLARVFRRNVIAEGVESVDHGAALLQLGCDLAQGYGIARPMPAAEFLAWAAAWQPDPSWGGGDG